MKAKEPSARELLDIAINELLSFNYKSRVDYQQAKKVGKLLCGVKVKLDDEEPMVKVVESENQ